MQLKLRARFLENLRALTGASGAGGDMRLGIAVSGGPDSMALLALAVETLGPEQVLAATVDHGLRAESRAEAEMVADFCARRGIDHAILTPEKPISGNIQSTARTVRYALLENWAKARGAEWIATAHHADDQLETLLMRLARGAGLDGLSGVRARNGRIIRPLLHMTKADLCRYCESENVPYVTDPSNSDADYDRVRVRQALENIDILDAGSAARSAAALCEAGEALEWVVEREAQAHIGRRGDCVTLDRTDYPREILRRLMLHCLQMVAPGHTPRGDTQVRTLEILQDGGKTMIGDTICEGGKMWTFRPAPPRKTG